MRALDLLHLGNSSECRTSFRVSTETSTQYTAPTPALAAGDELPEAPEEALDIRDFRRFLVLLSPYTYEQPPNTMPGPTIHSGTSKLQYAVVQVET